MSDWCIENDFAAQKEMGDMAIYGLQNDWHKMKSELQNCQDEFGEYKKAMEFYFGRSRCFEALEQYKYKNENEN